MFHCMRWISRGNVLLALVLLGSAFLVGAGIGAYAIVTAQQGGTPPLIIGSPQTPSSEVAPTSCGAWPAESAIADKYGELTRCGLHAGTWVIVAGGKVDTSGMWSSGVIALYPCNGDQACLDNRNDHPFTGWTFVSPPYSGEISILREVDDQTLIIGVASEHEGHWLTFDVVTRAFAAVTPNTPMTPVTPVTAATPAPGGG